jgi:HAD superfamily hydrolase (TIGR01509 family)
MVKSGPEAGMSRTRAVIFDFGGTLFSYESSVAQRGTGRARMFAQWLGYTGEMGPVVEALRNGARRAGERHFPRPFYLHREMFADAARLAAEELGYTLPDARAQEWAGGMGANLHTSIVPRPGLYETLRELRRREIHVGAASNADCDQFERMVEGLKVRPYFDSLLCSEDARSCKPDPVIFRIAIERAGCEPHEAVFVGDTPAHDIVGAEAAGLRAILIEEASDLAIDRGEPRAGQLTIRELPELLELL